MLFALYVDPHRVKFTEYIPHILVRASSEKKARLLATAAWPKHPVSFFEPTLCAAALGRLRRLTVPGLRSFYFCEEGWADQEIREKAAALAPKEEQAQWQSASACFQELESAGRAGVLARVQNKTPELDQRDPSRLVFSWRDVPLKWPHPDAV